MIARATPQSQPPDSPPTGGRAAARPGDSGHTPQADAASASADSASAAHVERILLEIDTLPTLPAVATRLLSLTANDDAESSEVIALIRSDPALTAKVLAMCATAEKGVRGETLTVDRAVVLLGFTSVRNAVLSLKVFETFPQTGPSTDGTHPRGANEGDPAAFDRKGFWLHTLAVAVMAQRIAELHPKHKHLRADLAFVAGLIHDLGKVALHMVLPRAYGRVIELAEINAADIAGFERRVMGVDHHTAGKRLAELWQLPDPLRDAIWQHGMPYDAVPAHGHRHLVGLVQLADLHARRLHIGYSGNHDLHPPRFHGNDPADQLAQALDLDPAKVQKATRRLLGDVHELAKALGLEDSPTHEAYLRCVERANEELGYVNASLERRARTAQRQGLVLDAIHRFHTGLKKAESTEATLAAVARSARQCLGKGCFVTLHATAPTDRAQHGDGDTRSARWLLTRYGDSGRVIERLEADPTAAAIRAAAALTEANAPGELVRLLTWLTPLLDGLDDPGLLHPVPLSADPGTPAFLIHDRHETASLFTPEHLDALQTAWRVAVHATLRQREDGRVSEALAAATAELADARSRLAQADALARVGEIAKGAAHEMNNPLTILTGRADLLVKKLPRETQEHTAALKVHQAAMQLSDLVTALHLFAEPPSPDPKPFDPLALVKEVAADLRKSLAERQPGIEVKQSLPVTLPPVHADAEHVRTCLIELVRNAVQAKPDSFVEFSTALDETNGMLRITVSDDAAGMDQHTLTHACDPFFSSKPAGRNVGMGLPRAKRLVEANGGLCHLRSQPGLGTQAALLIPLHRG